MSTSGSEEDVDNEDDDEEDDEDDDKDDDEDENEKQIKGVDDSLDHQEASGGRLRSRCSTELSNLRRRRKTRLRRERGGKFRSPSDNAIGAGDGIMSPEDGTAENAGDAEAGQRRLTSRYPKNVGPGITTSNTALSNLSSARVARLEEERCEAVRSQCAVITLLLHRWVANTSIHLFDRISQNFAFYSSDGRLYYLALSRHARLIACTAEGLDELDALGRLESPASTSSCGLNRKQLQHIAFWLKGRLIQIALQPASTPS
ncbi:unnamed protein product [Protopolystoma xenopodis]|uniref:Uncharacterized protein n=1 Tax=Protopolystoma xenopodis TaxID=117903 RepID=A0A3S5BQX1_9PLAT|nr:unnamed protein product [Protopolystoma xenopodis]